MFDVKENIESNNNLIQFVIVQENKKYKKLAVLLDFVHETSEMRDIESIEYYSFMGV
jgi:hypothetical protein